MPFKVFISYSHSADDRFAPVLQASLQSFARPWNQLRAMRVFIDKRSLSATPKLWTTIQTALEESEYFLLLASPGSARSEWVPREVQYWLSRGRGDKMLVALTDGEIVWDATKGDFDWEATTALPRILQATLSEPPLYIDFRWAKQEEQLSNNHPRFRDNIADLASTIHGTPKDLLIGEDVRQHRKGVRLRRMAISALAMLSVGLAFAAFLAIVQRNEARRQTEIAVARQMAAEAELTRNRQARLLPLSMLLAVDSLRRYPTTEADQTLRAGLSLLPVPVSQIHHKAQLDSTNNSISIAFTGDGKRLITASNNLVRVWDVASGKEIAALKHDQFVRRFEVSPDERTLATTSFDGVLRLWENWTTPSARELVRIPHTSTVYDVAFSHGGRYLATAADDGIARVWAGWESGQPHMVSATPRESIVIAAFSPDDLYLVSVNENSKINVWKVETGEKAAFEEKLGGFTRDRKHLMVIEGNTLKILDHPAGPEIVHVGNLDMDTDVKNVLGFDIDLKNGYSAMATDNVVAIRSFSDGHQVSTLRHPTKVEEIAFHPGGGGVATRSRDGVVRIWDVNSAAELIHIAPPANSETIAFSPDGRLLATGDDLGAEVWATTVRPDLHRLNHDRWLTAAAYSPDGRFVAAGTLGSQVHVFGLPEGRLLHTLPKLPSDIRSVAVSNSGRYLAGSGHFISEVWADWQTSPRSVSHIKHQNVIDAVAFSPDEKYLATAGADNKTEIWTDWQSTSPKSVARIEEKSHIQAIAFSPDSRYLVTGSYEGFARIWRAWNTATPTEVARLQHSDRTGGWRGIMGLAFSVDGRHLATSSYEQTRVWERWDGGKPRQVGRFEKSRVSPYGAFSQDGKNLTTFASGDEGANYACIWELSTGRELARVKHTSELKVSMFSPDGKYLLTGGQDYTRISLWHPDDLIREACRRLAFDVGLSQWRSFRGDEKLMTSPCDDKR